jgi:hypothetical protein
MLKVLPGFKPIADGEVVDPTMLKPGCFLATYLETTTTGSLKGFRWLKDKRDDWEIETPTGAKFIAQYKYVSRLLLLPLFYTPSHCKDA